MKPIAAFLAISVVALGAGFAYAQAPAGRGHDGARQDQRAERRADRMAERFDRRIGRIKADLKLTPQQEPLFANVEAQVRKTMGEMRGMRERRAEMRSAELPARLDMISERAAKMSANTRELSNVVKPLWATLDDSQKATVAKLLPGQGRGGPGERWRDHRGHHDRG